MEGKPSFNRLFQEGRSLELNAPYYILKRILPAVDRAFALLGVDVFGWYRLEARRTLRPAIDRLPAQRQRGTMLQYCQVEHCALCDAQCKGVICAECKQGGGAGAGAALVALRQRQRQLEQQLHQVTRHCMRCCAVHRKPIECRSLDCAHLYTRVKLERQQRTAQEHVHKAIEELDF